MAAATHDFTIERWATFRQRFRLRSKSKKPISLAYCTAEMQVRASKDSATVLLTLSTANGGIKPLDSEGVVELFIDDVATGALTFDSGVYDLVISFPDADTSKLRVLKGSIVVDGGVTR